MFHVPAFIDGLAIYQFMMPNLLNMQKPWQSHGTWGEYRQPLFPVSWLTSLLRRQEESEVRTGVFNLYLSFGSYVLRLVNGYSSCQNSSTL